MVAYDQRLVNRAINRLCKPSDGDIIVPQRRLAVVGTTSFDAEDVNYIPVFKDQVQLMLERGADLVPAIRQAKQRGAYMASRPLVGAGTSGRSIARTFKCFDHKESDNVDCFVTITGGKATTLRMMARRPPTSCATSLASRRSASPRRRRCSPTASIMRCRIKELP